MDPLVTISQTPTSPKQLHLTIALATFSKWITVPKFQLLTPIELTSLAYKQSQNSTSTIKINKRTQNNFTTAERPLPYG